ncbi:MAG: thioredoxin family protein [Nostocoides sp.]
MNIKILGPGCRNCINLEKETRAAVEAMGLDATIEKVTAYPDIMAYGIMSTPGLVVDEKVLVSGRVPKRAEIIALLTARPGRRNRPETAVSTAAPARLSG